MQGFRVWMLASGGSPAGFMSPFFEKRARAEDAMGKMNGQWHGKPKLEVKAENWPSGASGYFADEPSAR